MIESEMNLKVLDDLWRTNYLSPQTNKYNINVHSHNALTHIEKVTVKSDTNILNMSPIHFVCNINIAKESSEKIQSFS